jgi:hypothetical protein
MERSLQIESLYSSVLLLAHNLRLTSVQVITAAGSVNIGSPLADNIASLSPVFIIAALLAVYGIYWRKLARRPESASVINFSLAAILGFIVTSKILSPQYVIWVLPFLPLLAGRWRGAWWALFLLIGSLTYYIFPAHYEEYLNGRMLEVVILLCRNLLLVVFMLWLLFEGRHKTATPHLPDQTPSQ